MTVPLSYPPLGLPRLDRQQRVASTHSLGSAPDIRGYGGANGGEAPISCLTVANTGSVAVAGLFANGATTVGVRREFFPIKGEERVFVSRRDWEEDGIPKRQLEQFELLGKFLCYRIQHPSARSKEAKAARKKLLEVLAQTAPEGQAVLASAAPASGPATAA